MTALLRIIGGIILTYVVSWPAAVGWNDLIVPAVPAMVTITWHQMWALMASIYFLIVLVGDEK
jgi:hypothetical protein